MKATTKISWTIYYTLDGTLPGNSSPVYSTPISISSTTTIMAIGAAPGYPGSNVALATYSILLPTAPLPTFSPLPYTFSSPQSVKLSNTANLPMYYTLDGSIPTTNSTLYTGPIQVTMNTTINAISAGYGYLTSVIATGVFLIQASTPTFSPSSGTYYTAQNMTTSDAISGATIYYTTNGAGPTTSSTPCANPCSAPVSVTTTLKAIAAGKGISQSSVRVASYTITGQ